MAKKFKDYYNKNTSILIAKKIKKEKPSFQDTDFILFITTGIRGKAFLERQDIFAQALEKYLGANYENNIALLNRILGPPLENDSGMFIHGYWLWPIGRYVERNGVKNFSASINFLYQLTKRFTGEFAIRPLLIQYPKQTLKIMLKWSQDKNVHVRRLASEGARIHLPWAKKCDVCIDQFPLYKKILDYLRHDESKFVQKSVGNNLNDLYKNHPEKAIEIIRDWQNRPLSKQTLWIINHGQRWVRKQIKKKSKLN